MDREKQNTVVPLPRHCHGPREPRLPICRVTSQGRGADAARTAPMRAGGSPGRPHGAERRPDAFRSRVSLQRAQLRPGAGSAATGLARLTRGSRGAGQRGAERGRKSFSCKGGRLKKVPLESTNFYSKEVGKSNIICLFPPLKKSIRPSGRLSHWLGRELPAWTQFTAVPGEEGRDCHSASSRNDAALLPGVQ